MCWWLWSPVCAGSSTVRVATGARTHSSTCPEDLDRSPIVRGRYAPAALSHALGLALWLTGPRASQVFAFVNNEGAGIDLYDSISVRFLSGATGSILGALSVPGGSAVDQEDAPWPRHQLQVRIYGTEGHLVADLERDFLWLFREDGRDIKVDLPARAGLYGCDEPPNVLIDLTLGMAAKNRSPADVGARTVEILSAAYDSVRAGAVANIVTRHRSSTATP